MKSNSKKKKQQIIILVSIISAVVVLITAAVGILILTLNNNKSPETDAGTSSVISEKNDNSSAAASTESNSSVSSSSSTPETLDNERAEKITNTFTLTDEFVMPTFKKLSYSDSVSGKKIPYSLYLPEGYSANKKYPVIFFLHGAGERGSDHTTATKILKPLFEINADVVTKAIIVAPQCPSDGWWNFDDGGYEKGWLAAAMKVLYNVEENYSCDKNRIYVMGLSMGGYGTWSVLQRYGDHFAAGVPICGWGDPSQAGKMTNIPIWIYHGKLDDTVQIERSEEMYSAITGAGGKKIKFTRLDATSHSAWLDAFADRELISWMFAQNKSTNKSSAYTMIPYVTVVDANGKTVFSELDATSISHKNSDTFMKQFNFKLSKSGAEKLANAYTKSGGKQFTVYFGSQKIQTFTATKKPTDDTFIIDGVFRSSIYFPYYDKIRTVMEGK